MGSAERKLTNYCDVIDVIRFIHKNEISTRICGFGDGPLGSLAIL